MKRRGFTLVELIIVIAIIGLMAAILIPTFKDVIDNSNQQIVSIYNNINSQDSDIIVKDNETNAIIYEGKMSEWEEKNSYELISFEREENIMIFYVKEKDTWNNDVRQVL